MVAFSRATRRGERKGSYSPHPGLRVGSVGDTPLGFNEGGIVQIEHKCGARRREKVTYQFTAESLTIGYLRIAEVVKKNPARQLRLGQGGDVPSLRKLRDLVV